MSVTLTNTSVVITPTLDPSVFTAQTGQARRGLPLRVSPYINVNGSALTSVAEIDEISCKLVPQDNVLSVLVAKTAPSKRVAGTGGAGDGPGCADFDFSSSEMNLDLTGGNGKSKVFTIFFYAVLTAGEETVPIGQLDLTVYEDPSAVALAVIGSNLQNARITTANKFQLKDPDTGLWHDVFIADGQIAIGPGGS